MPNLKTPKIHDGSKRWRAPDELDFQDVDVLEIPIIHELGTELGGTMEDSRIVPPTKRPVLVKVLSQVVGQKGIQSREYMATVRRRKARTIGISVEALAQHAGRDDFVVCTHPVLQQINGLLDTLAQASDEGNTREILRQLRNTMINGGWQRYREKTVREQALAILSYLSDATEVPPGKVDEVFDSLQSANLNAVGAALVDAVDEDTHADE